MKTSDFEYPLPRELIAQQPAPDRAGSRMLIVHRDTGMLDHRQVADLPDLLQPGDLLVVNDTRVIPARLFGRKARTGGQVEVLLIEELIDSAKEPAVVRHGMTQRRTPPRLRSGQAGGATVPPPLPDSLPLPAAIQSPPSSDAMNIYTSLWEALVKASRPPAAGAFLELAGGRIRAEVLTRHGNGRVLLRLTHDRPLMKILDQEGVPPLPPYIKRSPDTVNVKQTATDRNRYQTVYAQVPGAIAAPTAGLHFTPELLERLERRGIERAAVTLHVGLGTFKPVTTDTIEAHQMEPERYDVSAAAVQHIIKTQRQQGRIMAVGSTVVRTLETIAAEHGAMTPAKGRSRLFIHPPYSFRVVQAMLTNFHLPASTLLMMVSAFAGQDLIRHAYETAIRERYRFYSYGDCMLIL